MKTLIYSVLFALIIIPASAQNNSQAKALLDKVSQNYKNKNSFYLKFNSELVNTQANTKDAYEGEVYVKKNKYNLTVPKMDIKQIYDGTKLYTISKEQQEVTVTKPAPNSDELFTPTRVFEMYKKGFNLSMDKTDRVNGRNVQYIKLTPTTASDLQYVLVGIDKSTNELVQLIETNANNTKTTVTIQKQLNNIIVPSGIISFNKKNFKGYYISEI
ncbi:MAG: LolA family protein [Weeksellaceae bacterium]